MVSSDDIEAMVSSAALVMVGTVLSSVSGLFERIIIGRTLGPSKYGVISAALAVVTLSATISMFGLTQGIPRYMSRFESASEKRGVWVSGMLVAVTLSAIVTAILLIFSKELSRLVLGGSEATTVFRIIVLTVPLLTILKISIGGIRGEEITIYRTYAQDLLYPISRIGLLSIFLFMGLGAVSASFAYTGGALIASILSIFLLNKVIPLNGEIEWRFQELIYYSAPLIISMVMSILLTRTDTLMIGYFQTSTDVGLYSAAYPVAAGLQLVLSSFGFLYLPLASRLDSNDKRNETESIYRLTTKWIYIITFPGFVVMVLFPDQILGLFWGENFKKAGLALSILSIGFFSSAAAGRNRETVSAFGYTKYVMYANTFAFTMNILLNIYLIPRHSYIGASIASAISFISLNIFVYVVLEFKFDINPFSEYNIKTFMSLPIGILLPLALLRTIAEFSGITVLVLLPFIGVASLFLIVLVGGLQPDDELLISAIEDKTSIKIPYVRSWL
ncbi:flippase [Haloarcula sp. CGMCC 1.2071]|uniref:flippase n=1 Tax=Haloarcula sp. CGMCC 1.2071 TaxID=3111454 RepID=UPI00300EC2CB